MPEITFQPVLKSMKEILTTGYYNIPRFQRPYAWDVENLDEFWSDVMNDNEQGYFIGPMVSFHDGPDKFAIVDGQQRITTITLALCAIRDAFRANGMKKLGKGATLYIERPDDKSKSHYVLTSAGAGDFLKTQAQEIEPRNIQSPSNEDQQAIDRASNQFRKKISDEVMLIKDQKLASKKEHALIEAKLSAMRDRIVSLQVIWIVLSSEDDAYQIFETLNSRGRDLEVVDLLKNHLLKKLRPENDSLDTRSTTWTEMRSSLQEDGAGVNPNTYLLHWWQSQEKYVSERRLFSTMKKENLGGASPEDFLQRLAADALIYARISNPSKWDCTRELVPVRDSLTALNLFGVKQPRPLVLSLLRAYDAKVVSLKHLKTTLAQLETFHYLTTAVMGTSSTGGVSQMYAKYAREIATAKSAAAISQILKRFTSYLESRLPSEDSFSPFFADLYFANDHTRQKKLVAYTLNKLHLHESKNPVDANLCNIEHIAPQSFGEDWVGRIGNLLWISQELNSTLGDKPFEEKQLLLEGETSKYPLSDVVSAKVWDQQSSEKRAKRLSEVAYRSVWVL